VDLLSLLQQNLFAFVALSGVLGLIVGSFLNVVVHRIPQMLMQRWKEDCQELTGQQHLHKPAETFNLIHPRSRCPHCGHVLRAMENIPVVSYLWLQGKCSSCKKPIGIRYPLVELLTSVLTMVVAAHFGYGAHALAAMALTWLLIALTFIDIDHHLLPDIMVLPFLWVGLLLNIYGTYTTLSSAVIGAVAGYLSLWLVFQLFRLVTGKEGMGYGDFKLFALFGAWLGWQYLLLIILISSFLGAVVGIGLIVFQGRDRSRPLPFGPYLALAGWMALLWGEPLIRSYLQLAQIRT